MTDLVVLKNEIDTDPLGRGYAAMNDVQVAADMSLINRPAENGVERMLNYCIVNRSRTNVAADDTPLPLLGRLRMVAAANIGDDPFGTGVVANQVTREMKSWALAFESAFTATTLTTLNFIDSEVDFGYTALGPGAGVVWKTPDIDALKAFSQNQQTRGQELGLGTVKVGHVTQARALP